MNREKHFHPLAALHLLRKTLLVYLLPLVQVLFDRNWDALRAALRQDLVLLVLISLVCWAVYYGGRWQVDAEGTVHVSWRLGVRLDRALRAEGCEEIQGWLIGRPLPIERWRSLTGEGAGAPGGSPEGVDDTVPS